MLAYVGPVGESYGAFFFLMFVAHQTNLTHFTMATPKKKPVAKKKAPVKPTKKPAAASKGAKAGTDKGKEKKMPPWLNKEKMK